MSAKAKCEDLIQEKMKGGMTRDRAAAAVFKKNPELRKQMVQEANEHLPEVPDPRFRDD